jgi:hypothetical protein
MFILVRAVTYSTLFIGLLLIYLPDRLLSWSGIVRPAAIGVQQVAGMVIGAVGAAVALWCIFTFASIGRGTPAPFDPPRRLVIQGPYRFVQSYVHWCRTRSRQRRALLRVVAAAGLCWPLLSRNAPLRGVLRGAHSTANLRARVRSILPPGQAMVAERMNRT